MEWINIKKDGYPPKQNFKKERRRYMVYSPRYQGWIVRCWYNGGKNFGCDLVGSMVSGATHYRVAKRSEHQGDLTSQEIKDLP